MSTDFSKPEELSVEATLQSCYDNVPMMMGVVELTENDIIHIYDNGATCHFFGTALNSTTGKLASELGVAPLFLKVLNQYQITDCNHYVIINTGFLHI